MTFLTIRSFPAYCRIYFLDNISDPLFLSVSSWRHRLRFISLPAHPSHALLCLFLQDTLDLVVFYFLSVRFKDQIKVVHFLGTLEKKPWDYQLNESTNELEPDADIYVQKWWNIYLTYVKGH